MIKKFILLFCLLSFNLWGLDKQNDKNLDNQEENLEDDSNQSIAGLRLTPTIGYNYYNLKGEENLAKYSPYAMLDLTYVINAWELGFGLGLDKILIAKKGVNVPQDFNGRDEDYETLIPSFLVLKYNIKLADNKSLIISGKVGNAFALSSNYVKIDNVNNSYQEIYFQNIGFLGSSLGYEINNWVVSLDYFAYETIKTQVDYMPVSPGSNLFYGVKSYDKDYIHKVGVSLSYRFSSFVLKD